MFTGCWTGTCRTGLLLALACWTANAAGRLPLAEQLSYERFQAYQGESFQVWGGEGLRRVIELTLEQVEEIQISAKIEQFTLHFSGPLDYTLDPDSYQFEHPESGLFRLWLEPAAIEGDQQRYRVDFNQLK